MTSPLVSVIIPTHNRCDTIGRTLDALSSQTFAPEHFEVIVVADGCEDGTAARLSSYPAPYRLRLIEQPASGPAEARNRGAEQADAPLLLFMDDDIEAAPELIAAHIAAHQPVTDAAMPGERVVVGYLSTVLHGQSGFFAATLRRGWEDMFEAMRTPGHRFRYSDLLSGNVSLSASLFAALGGFNTTLRCHEDSEFGIRVLKEGTQLCFANEAQGYHHEITTLDRTLQRKSQEGKADVQIGRLHPEMRQGLLMAELWDFCAPQDTTRGTTLFVFANRAVRTLAFNRPEIGDFSAGAARKTLSGLERLRIRHRWRLLLNALMVYWYWRGVASELTTLANVESFLAGEEGAAPQDIVEVNLEQGVTAAEQWLDEARPAGVRLRYGPHAIGVLPAQAGAERLRGIHLRAALASRFAHPFLNALVVERAVLPTGNRSPFESTESSRLAAMESPDRDAAGAA